MRALAFRAGKGFGNSGRGVCSGQNSRPDGRDRLAGGFSLIELLAVLAALLLIVAILLPVAVNRRPQRRGTCLNHVRQLTLGWLLYATDWSDVLIPNRPYANLPGIPTNNWTAGVMDWTTHSDNTNRVLLVDPGRCLMAAYVKSAEVYQCPAEDTASAAGLRVRSFSMNAFLGGDSNTLAFRGWRMCSKVSDLADPIRTCVIVEEHPNSLDDGNYLLDPTRTNFWTSLPASRHGGAGVLGFADGHCEMHKWLDAGTRQPVVPKAPRHSVRIPKGESGADRAWMLSMLAGAENKAPAPP